MEIGGPSLITGLSTYITDNLPRFGDNYSFCFVIRVDDLSDFDMGNSITVFQICNTEYWPQIKLILLEKRDKTLNLEGMRHRFDSP